VIRPFRADDGDAVARLLAENPIPEGVTGDGIRHWVASQPERARAGVWVAEAAQGVVGWARARLRWATSAEGVGEVAGFVSPPKRRQGVGAALYDQAHAHLLAVGARVLESWSNDEESGNFLRERGFRGIRTGELLRLELAWADLSGLEGLRAAKAADGYELVPLAAVADRPEELHAVDAEATSDVPGTYREDDFRLEDWLVETFAHPQLTREGSFVIVAAGRPVAYALVHLDPSSGIAANDMTGTHRDHRRRGLARLAKLASLAWVRSEGYEQIITGCDQDNAGMLHLNRSLGYRRMGIETEYLLEDLR
jgi:GNAT superfamily N-acetyltransferase